MLSYFFFFFHDTATTEIYTLSLHDALPISGGIHGVTHDVAQRISEADRDGFDVLTDAPVPARRISYGSLPLLAVETHQVPVAISVRDGRQPILQIVNGGGAPTQGVRHVRQTVSIVITELCGHPSQCVRDGGQTVVVIVSIDSRVRLFVDDRNDPVREVETRPERRAIRRQCVGQPPQAVVEETGRAGFRIGARRLCAIGIVGVGNDPAGWAGYGHRLAVRSVGRSRA